MHDNANFINIQRTSLKI